MKWLALALCFFAACSKKSQTDTITPYTGDRSYLALGDSYTIGQSVQAQERFPYYTVQGLRSAGLNFSDPDYIATTGWTTQNLIEAINTRNPQPSYDVVSLLIGVNDQYQRRDTGTYRVNFTKLLKKSIELAGNRPTRVFVLSIPDYSATPFAAGSDRSRISSEIGQFNFINREVSTQNGVHYLDITPMSREVSSDASLLANDGLHYSGKEHSKWAEALTKMILAELK